MQASGLPFGFRFGFPPARAQAGGLHHTVAVLAHEMGHQWWGHQIVPARVEGAALLSESLAVLGQRHVDLAVLADAIVRRGLPLGD